MRLVLQIWSLQISEEFSSLISFCAQIVHANSMSILHKELPYYFVHVTVIEEADRNSDQENLVSSGKLFCWRFGVGVLRELARILELKQRTSKMQTKSDFFSMTSTSTVLQGKGSSRVILWIPFSSVKLSVITISDTDKCDGPFFKSSPIIRTLIFAIPKPVIITILVVEWQLMLSPTDIKLDEIWTLFREELPLIVLCSIHVPTGR